MFVSTLASFLTFVGINCSAEPLTQGASLPKLQVVNQDGQSINLADFASQPYVLVYFYPKADTPGCTAQSCSLRDAYAELTDSGVTVIGVSGDSPASQKAFKNKYQLPFVLIADENSSVADAFGVPVRAGRFPSRQAFLFKDNKLVWHDASASTKTQADDVKSILAKQAQASTDS
ncbi:MAG: peroxiredoxin [Puniceicoccales bacterium]